MFVLGATLEGSRRAAATEPTIQNRGALVIAVLGDHYLAARVGSATCRRTVPLQGNIPSAMQGRDPSSPVRRQGACKMTKLERWVRDVTRYERLRDRHASAAGPGPSHGSRTPTLNEVCRRELGFGVRAAQDRLAVARLLERLRLSPEDLGDVDPCKLRVLARKDALPGRRRQALEVINTASDRTYAALDAERSGPRRAVLRRPLAVVIRRKGRGTHRVCIAGRRPQGQLDLEERAVKDEQALSLFLQAVAWQFGRVAIEHGGVNAKCLADLDADLTSRGKRVVQLAESDTTLFGIGSPAQLCKVLPAEGRAAREARRVRSIQEVAGWACRSFDWTPPTELRGGAARAVVLLALAEADWAALSGAKSST